MDDISADRSPVYQNLREYPKGTYRSMRVHQNYTERYLLEIKWVVQYKSNLLNPKFWATISVSLNPKVGNTITTSSSKWWTRSARKAPSSLAKDREAWLTRREATASFASLFRGRIGSMMVVESGGHAWTPYFHGEMDVCSGGRISCQYLVLGSWREDGSFLYWLDVWTLIPSGDWDVWDIGKKISSLTRSGRVGMLDERVSGERINTLSSFPH